MDIFSLGHLFSYKHYLLSQIPDSFGVTDLKKGLFMQFPFLRGFPIYPFIEKIQKYENFHKAAKNYKIS